MRNRARFMALGADSGPNRFDRLPRLTRFWRAFQLGVSRKMDRLSVPCDAVNGGPDHGRL